LPSLKGHRKRAGLSQGAVAAEVGVDQTIVSRWERDVATVPDKHLERLASLYSMTLAELKAAVHQDVEVPPPSQWQDYVIDSELSPYAQLVLIVIMAFRDEKLGVSAFSTDDLWQRARIPQEDRSAVWKEVLESGFVRRVGSAEWAFELVYPY